MQKITVDLSQTAPSVSSQYGGELGEHQAVELTVIPETAMLQDESIEFYYILFKVEDGLVSSRTYNVGEEITCALWDQLTALKQLQFQLIGTNGEETIVSKSAIITLYLGDSLEGTVIGIDDNRDSLIAMIGGFNARLDLVEKRVLPVEIANTFSRLRYSGQEVYDMLAQGTNVVFRKNRVITYLRDTNNNKLYFIAEVLFGAGYDEGHTSYRQYYAPLDGKDVTETGDYAAIPEWSEYQKLVSIHTGEIAESDDGYVTGGDVYAALAAIPAPVQSDYAQNDPSAPDFIKNKPVDKIFFVEPGTTTYSEIAAANLADKICVIVNYHNANAVYYVLSNFYNEGSTDYAVFSAVELDGKLSYLTVDDNNVWTGSSKPIPSVGRIVQGNTGYTTGGDVYDALQSKQNTLIAGDNITIENNVISATGGGASVQSDWNQSDSDAPDYIKNKPDLSVYAESSDLASVATSGAYSDLSGTPSLANVATSGDYDDLENKPTIPAAQVQADWNESDSSSKAYILNKPTIPTVPVTDVQDSNGTSLVSGGIATIPNGGFIAQSSAPSDTSLLWIDTDDNTIDETLANGDTSSY